MTQAKLLSIGSVREIYQNRMKADFPASELRPLKSIEALIEAGNSFMFSYEENGEILAYAMFSKSDESSFALLDYLAVSKNMRGMGVGGQFIAEFEDMLTGRAITGIILEVESPDKAADEDDLLLRKRRVDFYLKNGCRVSRVRSKLFGVDYRLMYSSFSGEAVPDDALKLALNQAYRTILSPYVKSETGFRLFARVFARVWIEK